MFYVVYCIDTGESKEDWRGWSKEEAEALADQLGKESLWGYLYGIRPESD